MEIILASRSERRQELLKMFNVEYQTVITETDENLDFTCHPSEFVRIISARKSQSALDVCGKGKIIITADTIVACGGEILGKPADEADAYRMLSLLSGSWHEVYTGIVITDGDKSVSDVETTRVKFKNLDDREIEKYIKTSKPLDKAGAYGIQDSAALFIERIEGDYYNVVGLPMFRLSTMLREFNIYL